MQLTLGQLIYELEKYDAATEVAFDFVSHRPTTLDSYRGIYAHLALGYRDFETGPDATVGALLEECRQAVGKEYTGWKGGDYVMGRETPMWVANRGYSGNTAIVGVIDVGWKVVINTAFFDFYG